MRFVDRSEELKLLTTEYKRQTSSMVIIYGRRRVGKTALIREFIKDKSAIYFCATEEPEAMNRLAFQNLAAGFLRNDLLSQAVLSRWDPVFEQIRIASQKERIVVVIDEFQYLGKSNPAFLSVFQRVWDLILQDSNVMLILCGSLVSMMTEQTLSRSSPLYGRRTTQIHLRPVAFFNYHEFFDTHFSERELIDRYSITGGVPKYIEMFSENQDLWEAVYKSVLVPSGYLFEEPEFLLHDEVSETGSYFSILRVIAAGNHKLSNIATALQQKQTSLPRYFNMLIDLDILLREVPVTESNPAKSKKGLYQIKDNFIRFWFNFVYPYRSYIEIGHPEVVHNALDSGFIDNHVSFVYEQICQKKLWELSAKGVFSCALERIGRWWDSCHEIDVVGLSEKGHLLVLGECKFWSGRVGINVLSALEEKARFVKWHNEDRRIIYVIFSINGFSDDLRALSGIRKDLLLYS